MRYIRYTLRETAGGEKITIPVPESYRDCFTLIQSDKYRTAGRIVPVWKIWLQTFGQPTNAAFFWMRMRAYRKGWLTKVASAITHYYKAYHGIYLDTDHVGYGVYFHPPFHSSISRAAYIGNNVNLSQYSNFGTNSGIGLRVGNNVYIAPHVCSVSDNHIGSNVCVGAAAVITKDLMTGGTYAGNPAKLLGENKHPDYIMHPYPIPEIPEDKITDIDV